MGFHEMDIDTMNELPSNSERNQESSSGSVDLSGLRIDKTRKSKPPRRTSKWTNLLWLLLIPAIYFGYEVVKEQIRPSTKVRTATAQLLTGTGAQADLVATGYVVARVKAAVASKATGQLEVLNVEEGDQVKRGAVIAIIENDDVHADLSRARAQVEVARAESLGAVLDYNRKSELLPSGSTTQEVVDAAEARYKAALANLGVANAGVEYASVAYENTFIRAPFDGTVLTKDADVGEMVAPFASAGSSRGAVVTLADMSSLEVEADVSESNIYKVKVGRPCEIVLDAYPNFRYPGRVKKIVPTADRSRATVMTKIAFEEIDERVLPEMSARVNFLGEQTIPEEQQEPIITIRSNAITSRDGKYVVFKIIDGKVEQSEVEVGRELGAVTEVITGLNVGEKVVLQPPGGMNSGDKVEESN
jgi:RND family efflux transporter MFP subunit